MTSAHQSQKSDSEAFPMDASWADLHHDKGQLSRASLVWGKALIHARLDAGESPFELAVHCWLMGKHGAQIHNLCLATLFKCAPEAALAFVDPLAASPALNTLSLYFEDAALNWTPPTDPKLRGWGRLRLDEQIQDVSRSRFLSLARACRQANQVGLPQALELAVLDDWSWLEQPAQIADAQPQPQPRGVSSLALTLVTAFAVSRGGFDQEARRQSEPRATALLASCVRALSPRSFCSALTLLCPTPLEVARVGGEACATASDACAALLGMKSVAPLTFENPDLPLPLSRKAEAARCQMGRSRHAFWKVGNLCVNYESDFPGVQAAFAKAFSGCPLDDPRASISASQRVTDLSGGMQHLAGGALVLSEGFELGGGHWKPTASAKTAVWGSHMAQFKRMQMENIPKSFAARHLALAFRFADAALEAGSLSLAPPRTLAEIELLLLSQSTLRYEPELDSECPEASLGVEPPRATRRVRI